jgi:osmotically-inducible protein OsmY
MKIKILAVLSLAVIVFAAGCRGGNNAANNTNTTNANMNTAMPTTTATVAAKDATAESAVKAAMDKAGYKDVTVDANASEVTLRGTVPKGKLGDAVRIATETGKRKVNNQLTEK